MKTALLKLGLLTGIALAMPALAAVSIGVAADPDLAASRDDKASPTNQFVTAYNSMSLADWLTKKGMPAEAADLYTEALNLFIQLAADYPQWQPAVVSFRTTYCHEALQRLQGQEAKDDGRQTTENQQPGSASRQSSLLDQETLDRTKSGALRPGESAISNQQSTSSNQAATSPAATLSPLNFKLQQAALRERGRDCTGALAMYIALLEEYPQEIGALKGACRCYLRLGNTDRARALIRPALTLSAPDAEMYLLAALVDCHDGRYQTAIHILRQSLKQNGACPETHTALGVALAAIGQLNEGREEMKRALSLNPKLGDAYYNLARMSLRQKPTDRDTARVHYQNALRHGSAPDPELDALLAE